MKAIRNLIAFFLVVVAVVLCGCVVPPVKQNVSVPELVLQERKPIEVVTPTNQTSAVDLGNVYTFTEARVQEQKAELAVKKPPAKKPIVVKPIAKPEPKKTVTPAPVKSQVKPIVAPIKAEVKPATAKLPTLPPNAIPLLPLLRKTLDLLWSKIPARSYMAAKIEQETCISLKHSKCWSTRAELKTSREYGFGLGQTTVAYNKDGSERFNVWKDLIRIDPVLKAKWTWDNRFDAELQVRATVVKSKMSYDAVRFPTYNQEEHLAFGFVTYNSGSVLIDRRLCINIKGCDPSRWYGHVELHSSKSKVAQKGYGQSFFEISRSYPRNIMYVRRDKYIPYMDK